MLIKNDKQEVILDSGKYFGEYGVLYNQNSPFSIIANEETHFVTIKKDIFKDIFSKLMMKSENERRIFLKTKFDVFETSNRFDEYYNRISVIV